MESFARVLVGLLFAALVLQLIYHGWGGVRHWLSAKFLGQ